MLDLNTVNRISCKRYSPIFVLKAKGNCYKNLSKLQREKLKSADLYGNSGALAPIKSRRELVLFLGLGRVEIKAVKKALKIFNFHDVELNHFISPHENLANVQKITLSKCCTPSLSDNIIGIFSKKKRAVRVHENYCSNIDNVRKGGKLHNQLFPLDWNSSLLGVSLRITLNNKPGALLELIQFLQKQYCNQYNIHSVTPRIQYYTSHILIHIVLKKEHSLSKLLCDMSALNHLTTVHVKDSFPIDGDMVEHFFRIA